MNHVQSISQLFQDIIVDVFSDKTDEDIIQKLSNLTQNELDELLLPIHLVSHESINHLSILHVFPLRFEVFKWLIEKGANPDIKDDYGKKPIDLLNPNVDVESYEKIQHYLEYLKIKKEKDLLQASLKKNLNQTIVPQKL